MRVIVTGLILQHRSMGGVAWDYLNFVLGFQKLVHEVYYIEDSGEWPYLESGPDDAPLIAYDVGQHVRHLADTFEAFGLADRWAYRFPIRDEWYGLPESRRREVVRSADLLLNVSGTLEYPDQYRSVARLVYVDTDPAFTQIEVDRGGTLLKERGALGRVVCGPGEPPDEQALAGWTREEVLRRRVDLHDVFFTVGETLGAGLPDTGHAWLPTKHPIVLSEWSSERPHRGVYTTVANWTSYKPVHYNGRTFGQKDIEMIRFIDLPKVVPSIPLEIAMSKVHHVTWQSEHQYALSTTGREKVDLAGETPQGLLRRRGWRVVPAEEMCGDFNAYRDYLTSSKGEVSVAKHGYVCSRSGWFSGRSGCYLAAGRPVVVQDTGFGSVLPTGRGVLTFSNMQEAEAAIREVDGAYDRHARAASMLAKENFDSDKVLTKILNAC
jgi:hypothetical protein